MFRDLEYRDSSVIRDIRQKVLVRAWERLRAQGGTCPSYAQFGFSRVEDELPDIGVVAICYDAAQPRFKVESSGSRIAAAFSRLSAVGRYLDEVIDADQWKLSEDQFHACVSECMPVYSVYSLEDADGRSVSHERLLLPFCDGCRADRILASLKSISIDGAFLNEGLLRRDIRRTYSVKAIINQVSQRSSNASSDDLVEMDPC